MAKKKKKAAELDGASASYSTRRKRRSRSKSIMHHRSCSDCAACQASLRPKHKKRKTEKNNESKYGSVTKEVSAATARGQKLKEDLGKLLNMKFRKNKKISEILTHIPNGSNSDCSKEIIKTGKRSSKVNNTLCRVRSKVAMINMEDDSSTQYHPGYSSESYKEISIGVDNDNIACDELIEVEQITSSEADKQITIEVDFVVGNKNDSRMINEKINFEDFSKDDNKTEMKVKKEINRNVEVSEISEDTIIYNIKEGKTESQFPDIKKHTGREIITEITKEANFSESKQDANSEVNKESSFIEDRKDQNIEVEEFGAKVNFSEDNKKTGVIIDNEMNIQACLLEGNKDNNLEIIKTTAGFICSEGSKDSGEQSNKKTSTGTNNEDCLSEVNKDIGIETNDEIDIATYKGTSVLEADKEFSRDCSIINDTLPNKEVNTESNTASSKEAIHNFEDMVVEDNNKLLIEHKNSTYFQQHGNVKDYTGHAINLKSNTSKESLENEDGFLNLWREMDLAFEYSKDGSYDLEEDTKKKLDCNHIPIYQDDLGLVCRLCGLVVEQTESIFHFKQSRGRKRHRHKEGYGNASSFSETAIVEADNYSEKQRKLPVVPLILHPMLEERMHKHQIQGFKFLVKNLITEEPGGCILAHAPGTGKTFLVTSFIQSFLQKYPEERTLVVAPKSVLCSWKRELEEWQVEDVPIYNLYDAMNYSKMETTRCHQLEVLNKWKAEKKSILLVSYAQFSSIVSEKLENEHTTICQARQILLQCPGLLVLDEGHFPRNSKTHILNALMQVHTRRRILLSGTLFQNNVTELFNLLRLARPDVMDEEPFKWILKRIRSSSDKYSKSTSKRPAIDQEDKIFLGELENCLQSGSKQKRAVAIHDLQELASSFVDYYKGEILEHLPGLTDLAVILTLNTPQMDAIQRIRSSTLLRMGKVIKEAAICIHPALQGVISEKGEHSLSQWLDTDLPSELTADPNVGVKTKFIMDLLLLCQLNNEKLLVFSQFLSPLALLENIIIGKNKWCKGKQILRLDGNMASEAREDIIRRFNSSLEAKVMFASIKACGEGINLTGASRVVLLDIQWNPSITRQAISRAFRIGQKKKVFAYRLVAADTLEEEIFKAAFDKEILSKLIFDGQDHSQDAASNLMFEVACDGINDPFFQSMPLRKNLKALYKLELI